MKISFQWLCEFVHGLEKINTYELAEQLTLKSFEVEEVVDQKKQLKDIVVGKIVDINKHPNADKLLLVETDIGKKIAEIVCGCTNLQKGQLVAVALPGSWVKWHGEGEPVRLEESEIRGVKSFGMICTSSEIGVEDFIPQRHDREACVLNSLSSAKAGALLSSVLGLDDFIIEVDNKTLTNRPDLWGHVGIAREAAAIFPPSLKLRRVLYNKTLYKFHYQPAEYTGKYGKEKFSVVIKDRAACRRYSGALLSGIKVEPSPVWMQRRLIAVGLRPINNIVDATNYVMIEIGQPMHAFDRSKIFGDKLFVDTLKQDQKVIALDKKEYELPKGSVVIQDKREIQAVGGIIGGSASEISENTTECFLESANFHPSLIRRSSLRAGIRTDASSRHEKHLDPNYTIQGLFRAIELIRELCPNVEISSKLIDIQIQKPKKTSILVEHEYLEKKIGVSLKEVFVKKTLENLGFSVRRIRIPSTRNSNSRSGKYQVSVPSYRATKDIQSADDLVEEVARVYGYGNISPKFPVAPILPPKKLPHLSFIRELKNIMAHRLGFMEIYSYVFEDESLFSKLNYDAKDAVEILNSVQKDLKFLKTDLVPGILRAVRKNQTLFESGKLFELGRTFHALKKNSEGLPEEKFQMALASFGNTNDHFSELKGFLEALFAMFGLQDAVEYRAPEPAPHRFCGDEHARIHLSGKEIGYIGGLNKKVVQLFDLKKPTIIAVFEIQPILEALQKQTLLKKFRPIPKFPSIELDISAIVGESVFCGSVVSEIGKLGERNIEHIELFDIYRGEGVEYGKKSIAFRVRYRSSERTLELREAEEVQKRIRQMLVEKFHAQVREK